jgi:hypothetical protein
MMTELILGDCLNNLPEYFTCPKCKRVIGTFCNDVLIMNGLIVKELHAVCTCGHELHYTLSGKRFERLVEQMKEMVKSE